MCVAEQRFRRIQGKFIQWTSRFGAGWFRLSIPEHRKDLLIMNRLIWLVGAVVIVLFVLGYLGLR